MDSAAEVAAWIGTVIALLLLPSAFIWRLRSSRGHREYIWKVVLSLSDIAHFTLAVGIFITLLSVTDAGSVSGKVVRFFCLFGTLDCLWSIFLIDIVFLVTCSPFRIPTAKNQRYQTHQIIFILLPQKILVTVLSVLPVTSTEYFEQTTDYRIPCLPLRGINQKGSAYYLLLVVITWVAVTAATLSIILILCRIHRAKTGKIHTSTNVTEVTTNVRYVTNVVRVLIADTIIWFLAMLLLTLTLYTDSVQTGDVVTCLLAFCCLIHGGVSLVGVFLRNKFWHRNMQHVGVDTHRLMKKLEYIGSQSGVIRVKGTWEDPDTHSVQEGLLKVYRVKQLKLWAQEMVVHGMLLRRPCPALLRCLWTETTNPYSDAMTLVTGERVQPSSRLICVDLLSLGTLRDLLRHLESPLNASCLRSLLGDVAEGLTHLHSLAIQHNTITTKNIYIRGTVETQTLAASIGNFEHSKLITDDDHLQAETPTIEEQRQGDTPTTFPSDIRAFALVTLEMLATNCVMRYSHNRMVYVEPNALSSGRTEEEGDKEVNKPGKRKADSEEPSGNGLVGPTVNLELSPNEQLPLDDGIAQQESNPIPADLRVEVLSRNGMDISSGSADLRFTTAHDSRGQVTDETIPSVETQKTCQAHNVVVSPAARMTRRQTGMNPKLCKSCGVRVSDSTVHSATVPETECDGGILTKSPGNVFRNTAKAVEETHTDIMQVNNEKRFPDTNVENRGEIDDMVSVTFKARASPLHNTRDKDSEGHVTEFSLVSTQTLEAKRSASPNLHSHVISYRENTPMGNETSNLKCTISVSDCDLNGIPLAKSVTHATNNDSTEQNITQTSRDWRGSPVVEVTIGPTDTNNRFLPLDERETNNCYNTLSSEFCLASPCPMPTVKSESENTSNWSQIPSDVSARELKALHRNSREKARKRIRRNLKIRPLSGMNMRNERLEKEKSTNNSLVKMTRGIKSNDDRTSTVNAETFPRTNWQSENFNNTGIAKNFDSSLPVVSENDDGGLNISGPQTTISNNPVSSMMATVGIVSDNRISGTLPIYSSHDSALAAQSQHANYRGCSLIQPVHNSECNAESEPAGGCVKSTDNSQLLSHNNDWACPDEDNISVLSLGDSFKSNVSSGVETSFITVNPLPQLDYDSHANNNSPTNNLFASCSETLTQLEEKFPSSGNNHRVREDVKSESAKPVLKKGNSSVVGGNQPPKCSNERTLSWTNTRVHVPPDLSASTSLGTSLAMRRTIDWLLNTCKNVNGNTDDFVSKYLDKNNERREMLVDSPPGTDDSFIVKGVEDNLRFFESWDNIILQTGDSSNVDTMRYSITSPRHSPPVTIPQSEISHSDCSGPVHFPGNFRSNRGTDVIYAEPFTDGGHIVSGDPCSSRTIGITRFHIKQCQKLSRAIPVINSDDLIPVTLEGVARLRERLTLIGDLTSFDMKVIDIFETCWVSPVPPDAPALVLRISDIITAE